MTYCEPYQSCALFGAMRYFSNLKDCISLINGPTGCTFYANNAIVKLNGYFNAPYRVEIPKIFCVDFNEKDAILGSENKVRRAAEELIETFNPKVLFIFNCCVSEIIGSDIDYIADVLAEKHSGTVVIPVHTAGFRGDHKFGMRLASEILVNSLFGEKTAVKKRKVNILGEFDHFNRSTVELRDFFKKIGITDINYIPGKSSLEELRDASNAELNIITCQNASKYLALLMKEKYNIPWIGDGHNLYGIENTYELYKEICDFWGIATDFLDDMKKTAYEQVNRYLPQLKGKTAVVVASTRRALGYSAILKELGIGIKLIFSEADEIQTKKEEFLKFSHNVMYNEYANRLVSEIEKADVDFVFSTLPEIIAPIKYIKRPEVDYSGMDGCVRMAKYLCELSTVTNDKKTIFVDE